MLQNTILRYVFGFIVEYQIVFICVYVLNFISTLITSKIEVSVGVRTVIKYL